MACEILRARPVLVPVLVWYKATLAISVTPVPFHI